MTSDHFRAGCPHLRLKLWARRVAALPVSEPGRQRPGSWHRAEDAWIHVDGAFGLWAAVSPELRIHLKGLERADSWATDAHKWLNIPYDSGVVIVKNPAQHRSLKTNRYAYASEESEGRRDGSAWAPENSRRARAFVLYAVLRELGRSGVGALVERCCMPTRQFALGASQLPGTRVLNYEKIKTFHVFQKRLAGSALTG